MAASLMAMSTVHADTAVSENSVKETVETLDVQEAFRYIHDPRENPKAMDILHEMRDQGKSIEEMARAVSAERNRLRLDSYKDDPEGLEKAKQSNLETYGHEEGPLADELYEKYGSWESVLQKSFSSNMGMDACCGLYDEYYTLYQELGLVEETDEE